MVTMPAVPPCSSITTAMCARLRRIAASTFVERRGRGHVGQRPRVAARDRPVRHQVPQQHLDVHAADNVVEVAVVDGIAGVRVAADDLAQLVHVGAGGNAHQPDARHHHLARRQAAELEQLAQDAARFPAQHPALVAFFDDELQLLGGVMRSLALPCRVTPSIDSSALPAAFSTDTSGEIATCER